MFQRIFSDPEFASALERDPEQALRDVGFELDEQAVDELNRIRGEHPEMAEVGPRAIPAVAVGVRVATSPAIRTGTSPVVQVAVRTNVPTHAQADYAQRLQEADEEDRRKGAS